MKKRIFAFLATICLGCGFVLFAACDQTPDNGDKDNDNVVNTVVFEKDTVTLQQGGWTRLLFTATLENEHVEFTSADESIVTVGATGYVQAYGKTGTTTITITGSESKASDTCTVTVTEIALDFPDTEEEGILLLNSSAGSFSSRMPDHLTVSTDEGNNSVTQFKYDAEAATGGENWNNQIYYTALGGIDLRECDSISFNLRGSGESVSFQIWNNAQQKSISTTATAGYGWTQTTLTFTDEQKTLLDPAESPLISFVVPYPDAGYEGNGGTVELCGLWLSGYTRPEPPTYTIPDDAEIERLDGSHNNGGEVTNSVNGEVITINYPAVSSDASLGVWENYIQFNVSEDVSRTDYNQFELNIKGAAGVRVYVKLAQSDWTSIKEQEVMLTGEWQRVTFAIEKDQLQHLAGGLVVALYVPFPGTAAGTFDIAGIWLSASQAA